ncbi:MAG: hypothetical protein WDW38_009129 [Sanguina aurantia]
MAARSVLGKLTQIVRNSGQRAYANTPNSAEARWANYFPHTPEVSAEKAKKSLTKEMIGFMLLGPLGIGFMIYDFVIGLEEEHDRNQAGLGLLCSSQRRWSSPPYPWMRIRRLPGMPWGEEGLFDKHPRVAKVWPPEEGLPEPGAHGHH